MIRESPIPLYFQLKQSIIEKIENGTWKPGYQLPTEKWFCDEYHISRVTVRKALDELLAEGILTRSRGKSAMVAYKKMERSVSRLTSLHEELSEKGLTVTSTILDCKIIAATAQLADKLAVEENSPILAILRVRNIDGRPFAEQYTYLPEKYVSGLDVKRLETESLYKILENEFHLTLLYGQQIIGAEIPSRKTIRDLKIAENTPLLTIERTTFLEDESPIEYSMNYYVADLYNISTVLYR